MKKTVILISILVGTLSLQIQAQASYKERVSGQLPNLDSSVVLSSDILVMLLPKNRDEALFFYELDYNDSTSRRFRALDRLIVDKVMAGDREMISAYLRLSEFVDGYFAEAYFDNIDYLAENQTEMFCQEISTFPNETIQRLSSIQESNCKK